VNRSRNPVEKVNYKYVKQTGGHGQYGMWSCPGTSDRGSGMIFENKIIGGAIPRESFQLWKKASRKLRKWCAGRVTRPLISR